MKIDRIEIENLGPIRNLATDLNGHSFWVLGTNDKGKTTLVQGLCRILTDTMPNDIVTEGADAGMLRLVMNDGMIIKWTQARDKETKLLKDAKVIIETPDEGKKVATKKLMRNLFGQNFEITEYLNADAGTKKKMIASFFNVDFSEINQKIKAAEEVRKLANSKLKDAETLKVFVDTKWLNKEPLDPAEIMKSIETAQADNVQIDEMIQAKELLKQTMEVNINSIAHEQSVIEQAEKTIARSRQIIVELEAKNVGHEGAILLATQNINNTPRADSLISELKEQLSTVNEHNNKINAAKSAQKTYEAYESARDKAEKADAEVIAKRQEKQDLMKSNSIPVAGLEYTADGELLYNGLTIESLSKSRQTILAAQISMSGQKIPVIGFDASPLDHKNAQEFLDWCLEQNIQVGLERPLWAVDEDLRIEIIEKGEQE
jgi:hypothetical protein